MVLALSLALGLGYAVIEASAQGPMGPGSGQGMGPGMGMGQGILPGGYTAVISLGGRAYDDWSKVLAKKLPKQTHPAYPKAGKKKGGVTWRCKECHGWDTNGAQGTYGKGSHYTGIKGLRGQMGADPAKVAVIIRGAPHDYPKDLIGDDLLVHLAQFVSAGQIEMENYIDPNTKKVRGNAAHGQMLFRRFCAACHGFDGKAINFKTAKKPEYIGMIASGNPWEVMHKVANGQPGTGMPFLRGLGARVIANIVAYAQTLPKK